MKDKQRIVIIGSGISGMTLAVLLARFGYEVLILEKNQQLGGNLQVFSRNKHVFDSSVHYIGGLQEGGNMYRIFNYLGVLNYLELESLDPTGFDRIRLADGGLYKHAMGYAAFERELIQHFPGEEQSIRDILNAIRTYCSYFPLYNLVGDAPKTYYKNPEVLEVGAWELLSQMTQNQELIRVILGSGPLYNGERGITPFYVVALILNSYIEGSYRISGGGAALVKAFQQVFREQGIRVLKRQEVIGAEYTEQGEIEKVICSDGTSYEANAVISTLHPKVTIDLFGEDRFRKAYVNRIRKLPNTVGGFMLHARLKGDTIPFENCNYYEYFSSNIWGLNDESLTDWPGVLYLTFQRKTKEERYATGFSVMCYLPHKHFESWSTSHNSVVRPERRGSGYEQFKRELEQKVLKRLEERWPDLVKAIVEIYSSTPLTYRDFLNTPEGSMYGIRKDFNRAQASIVNSKTHIPNLYLSGQNLIFHGILGASIGALVTSFNFIDKEAVLKEI